MRGRPLIPCAPEKKRKDYLLRKATGRGGRKQKGAFPPHRLVFRS